MARVFRGCRTSVLVFLLIAAQLGFLTSTAKVAHAANNGLGSQPYMGWSSYSMQVYSSNNQWISAAQIKAQSDAMHSTLQSHGYEYINIDAGWNGGMDGYGRPIPSTTLYPDGFQDVIDYVHANGQKIGIYGIPGLSPQAYDEDLPIYGAPGCSMQDIAAQPLAQSDYWGLGYKIDFSQPCAQSYIDSIADLYGDWGIDFLKFDSVTPGSGISDLSLDARDDVAAWSEALEPYDIWLELSWALDINYIDTWKEYANGWRVDWDIECYCGTSGLTSWSSIARLFPRAEQWWRHAGPGGWNDFDSLNVGNGSMDGITQDERRSAMTLWAISAAPLYIGNDMTNLDSFGISLLTNDEVIAVDQAGKPARPISTDTDQQVWYANNGDGSFTVALFNLGSSAATVSVDWSEIGINGSADVRDLWSHTDLGTFATGYSSVALASHASRLFKVEPVSGTVSANDDDHGFVYSGDWLRNGDNEEIGGTQNLLVSVSDSSVSNSELSVVEASFNKKTAAQSDIETDLTLNGNTLSGISNGGSALASPTDYSVSGNTVAIKKEYLSGLPTGTTELQFNFSAGDSELLSIAISDTTNGVIKTVNDDDGDIAYTGSWQRSWDRGLGDVNDDVHYTETNDDFFEYTFTGTGIELISEKDSSQGNVDIYLDGIFQQTVNTYNASRLVQQTVYSATGFSEGVHTLKAVKKTGTFMLLDQLKVTKPDLIIPDEGSFNKKVTAQADITVAMTQGGPGVTGIANGGAALTLGTDYAVSGNLVTIKKEYIAVQDTGTTRLTLSFAGGLTQTLSIEIRDTSVQMIPVNDTNESIAYSGTWGYSWSRGLGDYNDDVHYTENNNDFFTYTFDGTGIELITEKDSSQGEIDIYLDDVFQETVDTYHGSRLAQQSVYAAGGLTNGSHTLKAVKKSGAYMLLDQLKVTSPSAVLNSGISPSTVSFDQNTTESSDLAASITWNGNEWSGISNGMTALTEGEDYMLSGSELLLKQHYLATLPEGMTNLTIAFTGGSPQTLTVVVSNFARGRYVTVNDADPGISYAGNWQHSRVRGFGDYKDDVHFTENNDDAVEFTFTGTGIAMTSEMDTALGEIDIYLDNVFQQSVNAYNSSRLVQQPLYHATGLTFGSHTLKAVKKSGSYMLLDQLLVKKDDLFAPDTADFDKNSSEQQDITVTLAVDADNLIRVSNGTSDLTQGVDYTISGNQLTVKKQYLAGQSVGTSVLSFTFESDFKQDVHYTETNDDYFEYSFIGTGAELVGPKGPLQGNMDVYVDGVFQETVNAYQVIRSSGQPLYSISSLTGGAHTLKVVKKSGAVMLTDQINYFVS
ncbi:X2-like carbohydrate binding domain-containing protein [Paenibacillus sp. HB172176]|uniref:X2-like carbohydrate binding domain-containing protein n=1 Tax=Paenibacillus sp. HB172176 TaxID=2493690 RepID=UPI001F0E08FD|nr:X2-like carbohydrate binding domain-containing protein [Paenibacillus sp. HB172176]